MNPRAAAGREQRQGCQSMPKDGIQRAIDKASANEGDDYNEVRYEGFGPGGVSLIVETLTDNTNRTVHQCPHHHSRAMAAIWARNRLGGRTALNGSAISRYPASAGDEETVLEAAMEAGAKIFSPRTKRAMKSGPRWKICTKWRVRSKNLSVKRKASSWPGGLR